MNAPSDDQKRQASLSCLVDAPELLKVRVLPAEFARVLGVSKQAVSRWIAAGKVSINPVDGRLDVQTAVQQVLRNTDPGRMRARVLRAAIADVQELRAAAALADERVAAIQTEMGAQLAEAQRRVKYLEGFAADLDCLLEHVLKLVIESELALRATPDTAAWSEMVAAIESAAAEHCGGDDLDALDAAAANAMAALDDP